MTRKNIIIIISASFLGFMLLLYAGLKFYAAGIAERAVQEAVASASGYVDISYRKVSVNVFNMDLKISDVVLLPAGSPPGGDAEIKIQQLVIHEIDDSPGIPRFLSFTARGLDLKLYEFEPLLVGMGYDEKLLLDLGFKYSYNSSRKEVDFEKVSLSSDNKGEILLSLNLGNISLEPEQLFFTIMNYPEIVVQGGEISYIDNSLAERFMSFEAEQNNQSISEYKAAADRDIGKRIDSEEDQAVRDALGAFRSFLINPDKITAVISPPVPVPVGVLMNTDSMPGLAGLLNVKFTLQDL